MLVVRRPGYSEADEAALIRETKKRVGEDTGVAIEYVEELPRSANGKLRFVVSELEEGHSTSVGSPA
jgi:acyl-coenzyme A synthetase/AMP-(fatty) acid ligase